MKKALDELGLAITLPDVVLVNRAFPGDRHDIAIGYIRDVEQGYEAGLAFVKRNSELLMSRLTVQLFRACNWHDVEVTDEDWLSVWHSADAPGTSPHKRVLDMWMKHCGGVA